MVKRILALALAFAAVAATPTVKAMYADALAREQAVRAALASPDALATILIDVRAVVTAYEAVVKRHPSSSYSDDALWNAGRLSLDAFEKFAQPTDKDTAVRLLKKLAATYPTSKFAKQVPEQIARMEPRPADKLAMQPPTRPADGKVVTIRDIRRSVTAQSVRVTIELDGEATFHDERIVDPDRVFLDLPNTRPAPNLVDRTLRFDLDDDLVRQVRVGRHPNNTTRVVLDAAGVGSYSVSELYTPFRLVIECARTQTPKATTGVTRAPPQTPVLASHPLTKDWVRAFPSGSPRATARIANAMASLPAASTASKVAEPAPTPMTAAPTVAAAPPPAPNTTGGYSMARQLGMGVSRIVIDPGHGGHDPGAQGRGITEAELVLDVSLRLQKLLEKAGVEVILTRTTDDFVPLQERPAIANRENADLFLSIHANASPSSTARGVETYFLNFTNNPNAAQVAARENAVSALSMGTLPDMVKAIALNNKMDESRDFAGHVQHAMVDRLRPTNKTLKDLGVKQAPFIVLIGATMPSVLAEISFITNPQEAKLLKGNAYRERIAESLFTAIRKYQTSLKSVQTVAHQ